MPIHRLVGQFVQGVSFRRVEAWQQQGHASVDFLPVFVPEFFVRKIKKIKKGEGAGLGGQHVGWRLSEELWIHCRMTFLGVLIKVLMCQKKTFISLHF